MSVAGRPLDGLRVLDFTHVLAGPFATRILGDMGADVVKINSIQRAVTANDPAHPYYLMWNRNKRALALDMSNPDTRPLCRELCESADIVIDNFSVGVLDRWGVGYEQVSKRNPGVIYVQMSGMGDGGPWSNFVTYAPTIHALAGLTHLTGVPGREDIGIGFSYNDHQAGLHGAVAMLAALAARHRSGRGQRVDVSQFEVGVNFAGPALLDLFANDIAARPCGNRAPYDAVAPHNVYRCAPAEVPNVEDERWIAIACMNDEQWHALVRLMGRPGWAQSTQFDVAQGRVDAVESIDINIGAWTADQDAYELMELCQRHGVPAGVVQNGIDLAERDPQLLGSGFLRKLDDVSETLGQTWVDKLPIQFEQTPCEDYRRVRELGEDNAQVLKDWLGMEADEVSQAEQKGLLQ
jgi:crotonobetainyl-CoA:carnitine CoA-transferase CaiB-like acyl-CoA transferase